MYIHQQIKQNNSNNHKKVIFELPKLARLMNYFIINNGLFVTSYYQNFPMFQSQLLVQPEIPQNAFITMSTSSMLNSSNINATINNASESNPPTTLDPIQIQDNSRIDTRKIRRKRQKNQVREMISAKKNSQSNIINHFFTYYTTRQCSEGQVRRIIQSLKLETENIEKMIPVFYNIMKVINIKRGKKYMNKAILLKFFTEEGLLYNIPQIIQKVERMEIFNALELSQILRKCFYKFLQDNCLTSILTSKRISLLSKSVHLQKRRKIIKSLKDKTLNKQINL